MSRLMVLVWLPTCQRTVVPLSLGTIRTHDRPCPRKVFSNFNLDVALITLSSLSLALFLVRII